MFTSYFYRTVLCCMLAPVAVLAMSKEAQEHVNKIEELIQQKKYAKACKETEYLGGYAQEEAVRIVQFKISKAKELAQFLGEEGEDGAENEFLNFDLEDLTRNVIGELFDLNLPNQANDFARAMLQLVYDKLPETTALIIEELFYQTTNPSFSEFSSLIDQYLPLDEKAPFLIFSDRVINRFQTVVNLLSRHRSPYHSELIPATDYGLDPQAIELGKKFVDDFFTKDKDISKKQIMANYEFYKEMVEKGLHDEDEETKQEADFLTQKFLRTNSKDDCIQWLIESQAGMAATVALSTALLMKETDSIAYINDVYKKLIKFGFLRAAESLKFTITRQPADNDADKELSIEAAYDEFNKGHVILNPGHVLSDEIVKIPEYLQQAVQDE